MTELAAPAVARFLSAQGAAVGGGALLPDGRVLTCAHVVNRALGRPVDAQEQPSERVRIDFPLQAAIAPTEGEVVAWAAPAGFGTGDLAVLELKGGAPADVDPLVLTTRSPDADESLRIFGFPDKRPDGVWKGELQLAGVIKGGWNQLLGRSGYRLGAGFSGCPIVDSAGEVVGVFMQADRQTEVDSGASIPPALAAATLGEVADVELAVVDPPSERSADPEHRDGKPDGHEFWRVPPLRNPNFTGRDDELAELDADLRAQSVVVLSGLGGVGKTQLALQYARLHADAYRGVWWVAAERATTLVADLAALAETLGLWDPARGDPEAGAEAARRWLERQDGWLLVFDNAPDPAALRRWLPDGDGHVLVTSRHAAWGDTGRGRPVGPLSVEDAAQLLQRRSGQTDPEAARALASELGELPLALEQAGAYMEATGTPLTDYLELFASRREKLLAWSADPEAQTVATTWELAFEHLREVEPAAADLLAIAAFLAPEDIPRSLFEAGAALPEPLPALADPLAFADAFAALAGYSLVTSTGDSFTVHRLVQAVIQDRLGDKRVDAAIETALNLLSAAFAFDVNDVATWGPARRLVPHVLLAHQHARERKLLIRSAPGLLNNTGLSLHRQARYTEAQDVLETALEAVEDLYGSDHPGVAGCSNNIGSLARALGDLDRARAAFERALAIDEAAYGPDHPNVAIRVNNLGTVLQDLGDFDGARAAFDRALAIDEAAHGPDHPKIAIRLNNVCGLLQTQGDHDGARVAIERALAIDEAAYGPDHPNVAIRLNNLGGVLQELEDLDGARAAFERALAIDEAIYGRDHPEVAVDVNNVGGALQAQGDDKGAGDAFMRALKIDEAFYGPHHPRMAIRLNNVGSVLRSAGDLEGARKAFERALAIDEAAYGPDHPSVAACLNNLGATLQAQGDLKAAEAMIERALAIDEATYGKDHPHTRAVRDNLEFVRG